MTAGTYTSTSTAVYDVYDSEQFAAEEASGSLAISPPWVDTSGTDELRIVTASPAFSLTDRLKLRITSRMSSASTGRRLAVAPAVRDPAGADGSPPSSEAAATNANTTNVSTASQLVDGLGVIGEMTSGRHLMQQDEVSEVNCTVESEREARCPSDTAQPGAVLGLEIARNGQDFVALASEVRPDALPQLDLRRHPFDPVLTIATVSAHAASLSHLTRREMRSCRCNPLRGRPAADHSVDAALRFSTVGLETMICGRS